ncbi:MAG: hypothetical protein C4558_09160 [Dehalococcoidia bacterium]|nr:MAG: hypothetical protein C4558_09160 [Dehalococcoidia bacterium]
MTRRIKWHVIPPIGMVLVATAMLTACSSSGTTPKTDGGVSATPTAPHSTVTITLKDFGVAASLASAPAGRVTFVVQNAGAIPHEFIVVKSDLAPDQLPQVNQKVVDVSKVQVVAETEPFDSGKKQELTAELQPGRYVLLCNVESHYISGMHTAFTAVETR